MMLQSVTPSEWKAKESAGNGSQGKGYQGLDGYPMAVDLASQVQLLPPMFVARATFNACLAEAARYSGQDDQQIAQALHISPGYMSKFMRGVAQQWARRTVAFMRQTNSLAPLQWMADQMGCDVVQRDPAAAEIRALQDRLRELERSTGKKVS